MGSPKNKRAKMDFAPAPLESAVPLLRFLRIFGGFPFKISKTLLTQSDPGARMIHYYQFDFKRSELLWMIIPMSMQLYPFLIISGLTLLYGFFAFSNMLENCMEAGMSQTDAFGLFGSVAGLCLLQCYFLRLMIKSGKSLSNLSRQLAVLKSFDNRGSLAAGASHGSFNISLVIIVLSHFIYTGWAGYVTSVIDFTVSQQKADWDQTNLKIFNLVSRIFCTGSEYMAWFSPLSSALYIFVYQTLQEIANEVSDWHDQLSDFDVSGILWVQAKGPGSATRQLVQRGLQLSRTVGEASKAFGSLLFIEFSICYFGMSFALFYMSNALAIFRTKAFTVQVAMGIANFFCMIACFLRLLHLTKSGQKLQGRVKEASRFIKDVNISNEVANENDKLLEVASQLEDSVPLRPADSFDLTNGSLASGMIIVLTFAIILLQFKMSE